MFRAIVALALALHGLGHLLFVGNAWGYWKTGEVGHARLAGAIGSGQAVEQAAGVLMLLPVAGFLAVTSGYVAHQGWWTPLALISAAVSGALVAILWGGLNTSSAVFALAFDAAVIAVALWQGRAGVAPGSRAPGGDAMRGIRGRRRYTASAGGAPLIFPGALVGHSPVALSHAVAD